MENESDFPLIPEHERSYAERYRLAGLRFSQAKAAASRASARLANLDGDGFRSSKLESVKVSIIAENGAPMSDAAAERAAKTSDDWQEYLTLIAEAREVLVVAQKDADDAYVERETIRMQFEEWKERNANHRAEMNLSR